MLDAESGRNFTVYWPRDFMVALVETVHRLQSSKFGEVALHMSVMGKLFVQ